MRLSFFTKSFFSFILFSISILGIDILEVSAAQILIEAPEKLSNSREPVMVRVFLETQEDTVSGISGTFSFPTDLFDVKSVITQSSVVSLWAVQPSLSKEKYIDGQTHFVFEGIFPGGFGGVRSPYYDGVKPGILFSVLLIPKNKGEGAFVVDDITLNSFDQYATKLPSQAAIKIVTIPTLLEKIPAKEIDSKQIEASTLTAFITRNELINRNAWYVVINERESRSAIKNIFIAEVATPQISNVSAYDWREITSPYVLLFQDRSKYVHVKIIYSDTTYALRMLPPVENSHSNSLLSRILVIALATLFVIYFYGIYALNFFKKKIH